MPGMQGALSSLQTRGEGWGTRAWVLLVLLIGEDSSEGQTEREAQSSCNNSKRVKKF